MFKHIAAVALLAAGSGAHAAEGSVEQTVRTSIKDLVQNAQIDSVSPSAMPGFQEVVLGGQVLYVSNDGKYLLSGAMWDVAKKQNLTDLRFAQLRKDALASLGEDKRIVYKAKDPKHRVTVFTDIDCGYCRKLHQQMADYNNAGITVEYLFFPRSGVGTESFKKAVAVWCAADRNDALTQAKNGVALENKTCANPVTEEFELGRKIGVSGTPAIITDDGTQIGGYLTPEQMLARLDQLKAGAKPN